MIYEKRQNARYKLGRVKMACLGTGRYPKRYDCVLRNVSLYGANIAAGYGISPGNILTLELPIMYYKNNAMPKAEVVWVKSENGGCSVGLKFTYITYTIRQHFIEDLQTRMLRGV